MIATTINFYLNPDIQKIPESDLLRSCSYNSRIKKDDLSVSIFESHGLRLKKWEVISDSLKVRSIIIESESESLCESFFNGYSALEYSCPRLFRVLKLSRTSFIFSMDNSEPEKTVSVLGELTRLSVFLLKMNGTNLKNWGNLLKDYSDFYILFPDDNQGSTILISPPFFVLNDSNETREADLGFLKDLFDSLKDEDNDDDFGPEEN